MKTYAAIPAVCLITLLYAAPAAAQEGGTAVVTAVYVEQAPGVLLDASLARGAAGPYIAELRSRNPEGRVETRLLRLPAGVRLHPGDRVAARGRSVSPVGSGPRALDLPRTASSDPDCIPLVAGK